MTNTKKQPEDRLCPAVHRPMQKLLYPQCGDTSQYRGCCTLSVVGGLCAAPSPGERQLANEAEGRARKTVLWSGRLRTALLLLTPIFFFCLTDLFSEEILHRFADKPRRQKRHQEFRRRRALPVSTVAGKGRKKNYQTRTKPYTRLAWAASRCPPLKGQRSPGASEGSGLGLLPGDHSRASRPESRRRWRATTAAAGRAPCPRSSGAACGGPHHPRAHFGTPSRRSMAEIYFGFHTPLLRASTPRSQCTCPKSRQQTTACDWQGEAARKSQPGRR